MKNLLRAFPTSFSCCGADFIFPSSVFFWPKGTRTQKCRYLEIRGTSTCKFVWNNVTPWSRVIKDINITWARSKCTCDVPFYSMDREPCAKTIMGILKKNLCADLPSFKLLGLTLPFPCAVSLLVSYSLWVRIPSSVAFSGPIYRQIQTEPAHPRIIWRGDMRRPSGWNLILTCPFSQDIMVREPCPIDWHWKAIPTREMLLFDVLYHFCQAYKVAFRLFKALLGSRRRKWWVRARW